MNQAGVSSSLDLRAALVAFAVALAVHLNSGSVVPDSHDTTPNAYVPISLLYYGDLAFSPLEAPLMFLWAARTTQGPVPINVQSWDQIVPETDHTFAEHYRRGLLQFLGPRYYVIETTRERPGTREPLFVGAFGPAAGLMALPVAVIAYTLGSDLQHSPFAAFRVAKWTAAFLTAGSVALLFLTALAFTTRRHALLLAMIYGLGSCVWSVSSQSLWQQTPELFFLSLGVLCMIRGDTAWIRGMAAGLAFSAAAACRPTALVVGVAAAGYLLFSDRRALAAFVLAALPITLGILSYNFHYFGSAFEFGQFAAGAAVAKWKTGSADLWQTPFWVGAAGLLVSPSRGLLIYTPFFAAAFAGGVLAWKERKYVSLRFVAIAVPALWLPAFIWFDWWGGWTYGYRPIVDSAPLLAILCVPALAWIFARPAWKFAFIAAAGWSIFVQLLGVMAYTPPAWNARPIDASGVPANIDLPEYRHRLWSLRDWQIGYLIANFAIARPAVR